MPTVYTEVEVEVDLEEFSDEDLLDEIDRRGIGSPDINTTFTERITEIFQKRRLGKDFSKELDDLIYDSIGRII